MKRRFISRIAGLLSLYFIIFVMLSLVQFANNGKLSRQIGALRINCSLRRQNGEAAQQHLADGGREYLIGNGVQLFFGGLEFKLLGSANGGFAYVNSDGLVQAAYPETVTISGSEVRFRLSGGQELSFYINKIDTKNLTISALFTGDVEEILVPFKISGRAGIGRGRGGEVTVEYGDDEYIIKAANIHEDRGLVSLSRSDPVMFYRVISDDNTLNFTELIVSGGMEKQIYTEIVHNWCDAAFRGWSSLINAGNGTEYELASYLAEAARRGTLAASVNLLPAAIRDRPRTFLLTPFLGGISGSITSLLANEQEGLSRIEAFSKNAPSGFLTGKCVFEYLCERGNKDLFNSGIEYVRGLNPSAIEVNMCAGIFEGWLAWNKWMDKAETENPFDEFLSRAWALVYANIKKDKANSHVFVADEDIDVLYNIRLGVALTGFGEATGNNGWAAVGRSLIISALSLANQGRALNARLELSADGVFTGAASGGRLTAEQVYRELKISNFYPHSVGAGTLDDAVWLWTVSPEISVSFQNNMLDIGVNFPPGETHYICILNAKPFSKIQIRNIDWRSDPQFERYNAPGWRYAPLEKILMVKMVHQNTLEHIRIVF
jgi:hypothetical protein